MSNDVERTPSLPRMPWYPSDFHGATRGWPLIARGLYRELLDAQWDMGGLPDDEDRLRHIAGATSAEWRAAWPLVREKFQKNDDGKLENERLEQHRKVAIELWRKRSLGARKTNEKRWGPDDRVVRLRGEEP